MDSFTLADLVLAEPPDFSLTPIPLRDSQVTLMVGEQRDLVDLLDTREVMDTRKLSWRSSNEAVVTVDATTGRMRAIGGGTAIVTLTELGTVERTSNISVQVGTVDLVHRVTITPDQLALAVGEQHTLTASVRLADGQTNGNVTWSSSDDTLAVVNPSSGQVTALQPGSVTIVASYTPDPKFRAIANLTINAAGPDPGKTTAPPSQQGRWEILRRGGADLRALQVVDRTTVYACGLGTLTKTSDAGQTWQDIASAEMANEYLVAMSFVGRNLGWVAESKGKIYRTVDGGATWEAHHVYPNQTAIQLQNVHFVDAATGYTNGFGNLFTTTDAGRSWTTVQAGQGQIVSLAGHGAQLWAIEKSADHGLRVLRYVPGADWLWGGPLTGLRPTSGNLVMMSEKDGWCLLHTDAGVVPRRTRDGGETWEADGLMESATKPLVMASRAYQDVHFPDAQHGWFVFGSGEQLAVTNDGGTTWQAVTVPGINGLYDVHMIDRKLGWAVGANGTVIRYTGD